MAETKKKGLLIGIIVGAVLAVGGIVLWMIQLNGGMVQTGMRNLDSWGLYIINFMFFVGLSAGGLIISSIPTVFGMEGFGGISKVAIWTSICCTVLAIGFVVVDMGQPLRIWELFVYSNLNSPLMWDIIVLLTYLILSIIYLVCYIKAEVGKVSHKAIRIISACALVCAVGVHTVTAWIFSLQVSHEFWYTALMGPWFVCSALVCGTALVILVVMALRKSGYLSLDQKYIVKMVKLLGAFIMVDLYFFGCDLLTAGFPQGSGAEVVEMLTTGALAPFFWTQIVLSALVAICCFVPALRKNGIIAGASVAAIIAIFCKRVQIVVGGFQLANIDLPTVVTEYTTTASTVNGLVYWPTLLEFGVVLGVLGLGCFLLCLGLKTIKLAPAAAVEEKAEVAE